MSRSYWHNPIFGIAGRQNRCKKWRAQENRRYRAYVKNLIRHERYDDIQDYKGHYGNEWDSPRDGKTHIFNYKYWDCNEYKWRSNWGPSRVMFSCDGNSHWHCKEYYKELMRK